MNKLLPFVSIGLLLTLSFMSVSHGSLATNIDNSPVVEILFPVNGTIVFDREVGISIKCTDDNGITDFVISYENQYVGQGGDHYSLGDPKKVYYYNSSTWVFKGYNFIQAYAYDENGNVGYNISQIFYNPSNDAYPPLIDRIYPREGKLYIAGDEILSLPTDYSIVISNFEIMVFCYDFEGNFDSIQLYLDDEIITDAHNTSTGIYGLSSWNCDRFILGMHEIKAIATDTFGNSASVYYDCLVFNIN